MTTPADDCCSTTIIRGPEGPQGPPGPPGPPGPTDVHMDATSPVTVTGSGSNTDPFILDLTISADPGNLLDHGTDGGLYVGRQQDLLCLADTEAGATPDPPDEGVCLYADNGTLRTINPDGTTATLRPLPATSTRIAPSPDADTMVLRRPTGGWTVLQSFAIDNVNQHIYTVQVMGSGIQLDDEAAPVPYDQRSANGDLVVSRLTIDGTLLDYTFLRGSGHGSQIGIDNRPDGTVNIWTGTDSTTSGVSQTVGYFRYRPSTTTAIDNADLPRYRPFGTYDHRVSVNIDPTTRRLIYSRTSAPGAADKEVTVFDLEDAYTNTWHPIARATITHNTDLPDQGHAAVGNYLYSWSGQALADHPEGNATLRVYDLRTAALISTTIVTALLGEVPLREPEGMGVWLPDPSCPDIWRLVAGFACDEHGARTVSMISWEVCAGQGAVDTITAADGTATVTPTTGDVTVAARRSADTNNTLTVGADGGLYAPATSPVTDDTYTFDPTLDRTGTGTAEDPYVVGVNISTDPDQNVTLGTDNGLYAPAVTAGEGIEILGGPTSALAITSRGYANYGAGQLVGLNGSATVFPAEWTNLTPDVWPAIDIVAPFTGYMQITVGAKIVNRNSDTSTLYIGWEQTFNGDTTLPSTFRALGVVGCGVNGTRSRIYAVTTGMTVTITPAFRASSYSTTPGVTTMDSGSLNLELFAA